MIKHIPLLIVAAGASRRLGRPKQLVELESDLPLLQKLIDIVLNIPMLDVRVVLGANAEEIQKKIIWKNVRIIHNPNWQQGMGSSISSGIYSLEEKIYSGVIISVVDQPFLSKAIFERILDKVVLGKEQIILSQYLNGSGPPVYFSGHFFSELKKLTGDAGAKPIVSRNRGVIDKMPFDLGHIDIDSEEDLNTYKNIK